jgi:hypothetical protein
MIPTHLVPRSTSKDTSNTLNKAPMDSLNMDNTKDPTGKTPMRTTDMTADTHHTLPNSSNITSLTVAKTTPTTVVTKEAIPRSRDMRKCRLVPKVKEA